MVVVADPQFTSNYGDDWDDRVSYHLPEVPIISIDVSCTPEFSLDRLGFALSEPGRKYTYRFTFSDLFPYLLALRCTEGGARPRCDA